MSEQTPTPREHDDVPNGTFVGGTFGRQKQTGDPLSTAEQLETESEQESYLADAAPAEVAEQATEPSSTDQAFTDVEGTGDQPTPGERNEPV